MIWVTTGAGIDGKTQDLGSTSFRLLVLTAATIIDVPFYVGSSTILWTAKRAHPFLTHCRVLPSAAPDRFCFTVWLSESRPSLHHQQSRLASGSELTPDAAWACLLHPDLRKHAARYTLREEWATSLEQSHPPSQERDALLANFWKEIGIIGRVVKPLLDVAGKHAVPPHLRHSSWL